MSLDKAIWHAEPPAWAVDGNSLQATSGFKTDFWRETHYGFIRDDGHFMGLPSPGEFTAQTMIQGQFEHLYDQAGLMLRIDERTWVKAGAEFTDGALRLSTVITDGQSDWSVSASLGDAKSFGVRLTLCNGALRVQASPDSKRWDLIRLASFKAHADASVGPMFCSPERSGLNVTFSDFKLGPAINTDLHNTD